MLTPAEREREFPQLQSQTYLNTCSLGALSQRVRDATVRYLDGWQRSGGRSWYEPGGWLETIESVRCRFARLIGAQPHEIALAPNLSTALASVGSALPGGQRDTVVTTTLDFPTIAHHWLAKERLGVRCCLLASPDRVTVPLDAYSEAIDDRTALVATARVFFTSGFVQDVGAIVQLAHERGALALIDDYQASGHLPIDVKALGVDVLVSGSMKWLLGGPGLAFLYVREELLERLLPTTVGWFGHSRQLEFIIETFEPREDARRFELGTPAIAAVYAADAGLELIQEIGVPRIHRWTRALTDDLIERLRNAGLHLTAAVDPKRRGPIVMVSCDAPERAVAALREQRIIVDARPGHVRIAPYFYNTSDDNARVVEALAHVLQAETSPTAAR